MTRRHFLQGAGGAILSLPFLPSLIGNRAMAALLAANQQKSFIGVGAFHGLYRMHGPKSQLMPVLPDDIRSVAGFTPLSLPGKHTVYARPLSQLLQNNQISQIINSSFNPVLSKMLMMQGLDFLSIYGHNGAQFGNQNTSGGVTGLSSTASIDQVMANSLNFYKNPALKGRSLVVGPNKYETGLRPGGYGISSAYQTPSSPLTSAIVSPPLAYNPQAVWDKYFGQAPTTLPLKKTLVDLVLADYKSVRGSRALASEDKRVLDQHIELLQNTQLAVNNQSLQINGGIRPPNKAPSGADWGAGVYDLVACTAADRRILIKTMNSVITSLISSGLCHSFLASSESLTSTDLGAWHAWAHAGYDNDKDLIANVESYNSVITENTIVMQDMCLDLALKLDSISSNGSTLLDSSLITCIQEHSKRGHEAWNIPVITFGSAGGTLKTGQYLDYRNFETTRNDLGWTRFGFPMNQLWANLLQAMDVPPGEFEALGKVADSHPSFTINGRRTGYGVSLFWTADGASVGLVPVSSSHYSTWGGTDLSSWLPFIKA